MKNSVRIFWKLALWGAGILLLIFLLINFGVFGKLPSLAQLENPTIMQASEVYASDGTLMGKFYREKGNRSSVKYRDISPHVIDALVATEDERFYSHSGIDGKSVMRAVFTGGLQGGGSTITQQLAKNLLEQGSKNMVRRVIEKVKEWIIAVKLERNFTKEEILTLYLNTVPFGDNTYGIRNASLTFFQKEPDRLTVDEAAILVGMLKGNTLYNPRRNPKEARDRRNTVMDQMVKNGKLTSEDATKLKAIPIDMGRYKKMDETTGLAPYFRDVLRDDLKKWCKEHKNPATGEPYDLFEDGLRIYTTINPRMQLYAEEAVAKQMPALQKVLNTQGAIKTGKVWKDHENILNAAMKNSDRWKNGKDDDMSDEELKASFNKKVPMKVFAWNSTRQKDTVMSPMDSIRYCRQMLQTSFMVMDPVTGEVKAWVGGIDFKTYKYDHVNINTKRQVGSTIKPLLYCDAIEEIGFTPETPVENSAQNFPGYGMVPARGICGGGTVTMANALAYSLNCASAYIMKQVTPKRFVEFLKNVNIQTKVEPYPSIALGACDLSMFEMMWSYSMFPNRGFSTKPIYITRIEDKNGNVLESFQTTVKQVISENGAYTMCRMMQGTVDVGTAKGLRARLGAAEMGGKTGTTNDNSDAWFMGYVPQLVAGTWVGCDDRFIRLEGALGYGGAASKPIWEYFFQKVYADKTLGIDRQAKFIQPESIRDGLMMSYQNFDPTPPPGAEGDDQGNGNANEYLRLDTANVHVPVDSRLDPEEQKVLNEAKGQNKKNNPQKPVAAPPEEEKKKEGFFKRLFGGKKNKDNDY
ncbi:penicillin-binding protein 1A [Pinibacter aurantiacus]|uniref:Penicillin-binding protein n=1 Tax=Pinibacter aurantiacus TaxID=2851599 RepID=A0A9E2S925_9BACT|nr:transglycosylase domain-containing protein [Pinibacter aurantiacus]MBV4356859.1 penicillin-binding protein [Pinibacter aurantiacus]